MRDIRLCPGGKQPRSEVVAQTPQHLHPSGPMLTWEWQRKPKPNMVTAGSKMVPRTSASRRRLKTATSRFWAVTSTAQAQQSRGSRGSGLPARTERWAPGTSAMAWLVPAPQGCGPYSPFLPLPRGSLSPPPTTLSWNAAPGLGILIPRSRPWLWTFHRRPRGGARRRRGLPPPPPMEPSIPSPSTDTLRPSSKHKALFFFLLLFLILIFSHKNHRK